MLGIKRNFWRRSLGLVPEVEKLTTRQAIATDVRGESMASSTAIFGLSFWIQSTLHLIRDRLVHKVGLDPRSARLAELAANTSWRAR